MALFDDGQQSAELVVCVARVAHDAGLRCGMEQRPDHALSGRRGLPAGCVEAAGGDDWGVWTALYASAARRDGHRSEAAERDVVDSYPAKTAEHEMVYETPL